jgi:hypothetical protein
VSQPTPVEGWSELLLALPEFVLTGANVDENDELVAHVELPRGLQPCTSCGVIGLHPLHAWRRHTVRHLPVAGRATRLVWRKRLLTCLEGCGTFVERTASIAPAAVWSRAAARAAVAAAQANVPVDTIRREFGVGWNTVMRAVLAAAQQVAQVRPTRVGIDETVMTTGRLTTRRRQFLTALVCLDILAGRRGHPGPRPGLCSAAAGRPRPRRPRGRLRSVLGVQVSRRHPRGRDRGR